MTWGRSLLDHLILVVGYVSRQAAGQEYPNELEECNPKRDPSDDSQVGLHHMGHPRKAAHGVDLLPGHVQVLQALRGAVGAVFTAAGGDAAGFKVCCFVPVSVIVHSAAMQSPLDDVDCTAAAAAAVGAVVVCHSVVIGNTYLGLDLVSEDKSRDTGHKLSQEHQGQKHGIQFEHPWAAAACSEAAEQSENNDDGSGPDEDIWCIGALLRGQSEVGLQAHLPPHADRQQDHACEPENEAVGDEKGLQAGDHRLRLKPSRRRRHGAVFTLKLVKRREKLTSQRPTGERGRKNLQG